MKKIIIIGFILLMIALISFYFGPTIYSKIEEARMNQLMRGAELTDIIGSPDGKWIAFVKRSHFVVPASCPYFVNQIDHTDKIWMINEKRMSKKLIVSPTLDCDDVSKDTLDPHHLRFSPDSKTLYFETSAWQTADAVHAVDVDGKNERYVIPGDELRIIQSGKYTGYLRVNRHLYRFKGDTPLGSYNADLLYSPSGQKIKIYRSTIAY